MPEIAVCPKCQARYRTGGVKAGRRLRCRKCRTIFTVQDAAPAGTLDGPSPEDAALPAAIGDKSSLLRAQMSASIAPSLAPSADEEKYTVEDEIARGGMGAVLRAADRDLGREVAMKVMLDAMDEQGRARFVEEARLTGQLEHPNIVPVHELGVDAEGKLFFTMKLVKGKSLAEVFKGLRENVPGALTLGRLLNVFVNVCNAMAFSHSKSVIHRDLKPANLMLGDFGEVLVMDWGLAKVVGREERPAAAVPARARGPGTPKTSRFETSAEKTMEGAVLGTPFYMPPEQARGDIAKLDARSDIYSLGAILYEILTLKPPVEGQTIHEVLRNVVEGAIQPPERRTPGRSIAGELSAIAMKALARDPDHRYSMVESLRHDIELYLEGRAVSAKADTAWETVVKLVKRNKGVSLASALAALVLLSGTAAGYWVNLQEKREAQRQRDKASASERAAVSSDQQARKAMDDLRSTAPDLVEAARMASEKRDWDKALANLKTALAFDADLAPARLLRAEVLIAAKKYEDALKELTEYLARVPGDKDAAELAAVCDKALGQKEETPEIASAFVNIFLRRNQYALAESHVRSAQGMLDLYNQRIHKAWTQLAGHNIVMDKDGKLRLDITDRVIADLLPLRGIPLNRLHIGGGHNKVTTLAPLEGMPLEELDCHKLQILDLNPLKGMRLKWLSLSETPVVDLKPLAGMPLAFLDLNASMVTDLSPLQGMPLKELKCHDYPGRGPHINDLRPLKGMPLEFLDVGGGSRVADLTPLQGMPLRHLNIEINRVRDLSPLRGMPLTVLAIGGTPVRDLTPLDGMKLETFYFTPGSITKGTDAVRAMESMKSIGLNGNDGANWGPGEFWRRYDPLYKWGKILENNWPGSQDLLNLVGDGTLALDLKGIQGVRDLAPLRGAPLSFLEVHAAQVTDLMPLKGIPLSAVNISDTQVGDLEPLRGMLLTICYVARTRIGDLSPLKGMPIRFLAFDETSIGDIEVLRSMPLTDLYMNDCNVADLSPLSGMQLQTLVFTPKNITKGLDVLRGMKSLNRIGTKWNALMPAAEFWKRYDAGEFK